MKTQTITLLGQQVTGTVEWSATRKPYRAQINMMRTIPLADGVKGGYSYSGCLRKGKVEILRTSGTTLLGVARAINRAAKP